MLMCVSYTISVFVMLSMVKTCVFQLKQQYQQKVTKHLTHMFSVYIIFENRSHHMVTGMKVCFRFVHISSLTFLFIECFWEHSL